MKKLYYLLVVTLMGSLGTVQAQCTNNYYVQDMNPWGTTFNQTAMTNVFGAGNWTQANYATPAATIFDPSVCFVMLEGGDFNGNELNAFLTTNLSLIETWVSNGGRLFINAAPNEGGNINLGFNGTTLIYPSFSGTVTAVNVNDPIFLGPYLPTATSYTGNSYGHATITGTDLGILLNGETGTVLANKSWGSGIVFFGGITSPNFHQPNTEAVNLWYNIFYYAATPAPCTNNYYVVDTDPWGQTFNQTAMNNVFGAGNWTQGNYSTAASTIFDPSVCFVMLEGGDFNANELNAFLSANLSLIETWVSNGGRLFINAAPNEGGNINLGFDGTTLIYPSFSSNVTAVNVNDPIFLGPYLPTATSYTGTSYGHATITGTDLGILLNGETGTVLANKSWGSGIAFFGGITSPNWHSPGTEAANLWYNIFHYTANIPLCNVADVPSLSSLASNVCPNDDAGVQLSIDSGNLNENTQWTWYSGSCGGTAIGTGTSIDVTVNATTTYYVRGEGGCVTPGACASITITAEDNENPTITAPDALLISADGGSCAATAFDLGEPITDDNCSVASVTNDAPNEFPVGTTIVTWTVFDASGNQATALQTVVVEDNEEPMFEDVPDNLTVIANNAGCTGIVTWTGPTAFDNCAGVTVTSSHDPGDEFPLGVTTVTYYAEDAAGNTVEVSFTVEVINDLNPATIDVTHVSCNGGNDGAIAITFEGGTAPFTYLWSNDEGFSSPDQNLSGLEAGEYNGVATDANGCTASGTVTVNEPEALEVSATSTEETNGNDGEIDLTVTGGTEPYTYSWTDGAEFTSDSEDLTGLAAGTYEVTVTDANGCTTSLEVVVGSVVGLTTANALAFDLYPNPTNDAFTISVAISGSLEVYGSNGQLVMVESIASGKTTKDVHQFSTGVYTIRFVSEQGVVVKRLVVNK
jgi:hypothetical protein